MTSADTSVLDLFVAYSHRDEALRAELETHLTLLKREGKIRTWHRRQIGAGREWEGEINRHLEAADIVLLLISPDFIASDYCFDREMVRALERHRAGQARVMPVILRPTDWQTADFGRLQALPSNGRAITRWQNRDEAFVEVVRGLRAVIEELRHPAEQRVEAASRSAPVGDDSEFPTASTGLEKDGSALVYVPGGEFDLGEEDSQRRVLLNPYWIGKHPVTNQHYGEFLAATGHRQPACWNDERFNGPLQPVVGVDWYDANAFCAWARLELPSEAQWEAAARGQDRRPYPWGREAPTPELADFDKNWQEDKPDAVGAHPRGAGPYGTLDQSGGVWEWCRDDFDEVAYRDRDEQQAPVAEPEGAKGKTAVRVVRGGAWLSPSKRLLAALRHGSRAGSRHQDVGFRCVDLHPTPSRKGFNEAVTTGRGTGQNLK